MRNSAFIIDSYVMVRIYKAPANLSARNQCDFARLRHPVRVLPLVIRGEVQTFNEAIVVAFRLTFASYRAPKFCRRGGIANSSKNADTPGRVAQLPEDENRAEVGRG